MSEAAPSLKQAVESAAELLLRFVVPLYETRRSRPELFGTGFLVHYSGKNFLVSAAHVLEEIHKRPLHYYIEPKVIRRLTGKLAFTHFDGPRNKDPIDIGVLLLEGEGQPPYPILKKLSMSFSYLCPALLPRTEKLYLFLGFPASRSKTNPVAREVTVAPFGYWCPSAPESDYAVSGYSIVDHLLLPLDVKRGYDFDGTEKAFPKPHGMSGSPIVMLYDEVRENNPQILPVVGIATTYFKDRNLIVATDIRVAIELIQNTPEFWH